MRVSTAPLNAGSVQYFMPSTVSTSARGGGQPCAAAGPGPARRTATTSAPRIPKVRMVSSLARPRAVGWTLRLTRTRDPTSATPRRAGSYVTACSEVPATSTVYSTFSPRNVRLRTIPTAVASPSGGFAFSGTRVMDSGRITRKMD